MLQLVLEIHPGGDSERAQEIGQLLIINDGTGTPEVGNYDIVLLQGEGGLKNRVDQFPRQDLLVRARHDLAMPPAKGGDAGPSGLRRGNAWELVLCALLEIVQAPGNDPKDYARFARVGDVVQVDPATPNCFFPGCFLCVTDVKAWGVQGYVCMPKTRTEPPGHAYYRAKWEEVVYVGRATWISK